MCRHYFIRGRVQGVWFRDHVRREAQALGLTGWVRNLPDGRVEALVCGDAAALDRLEPQLWRGSERARVDDIEVAFASDAEFADFAIRG